MLQSVFTNGAAHLVQRERKARDDAVTCFAVEIHVGLPQVFVFQERIFIRCIQCEPPDRNAQTSGVNGRADRLTGQGIPFPFEHFRLLAQAAAEGKPRRGLEFHAGTELRA